MADISCRLWIVEPHAINLKTRTNDGNDVTDVPSPIVHVSARGGQMGEELHRNYVASADSFKLQAGVFSTLL